MNSKNETLDNIDSEDTYTSYEKLVSDSTGEIVATITRPVKPKRLVQPWEKKANEWQTARTDKRHFFNVKMEKWKEFSSLDNFVTGYSLLLGTFMHFDLCLYETEGSNIPVKPEELYKLLGKSKRTGATVLNKLKQSKLLIETEISYNSRKYPALRMNPEVFYRGSYEDYAKNEITAKAFNEVIKQLYKENGAKVLSFVAKLIPYLDKQTNTLGYNHERNVQYEDLIHLTMKDISEITGISTKQAAKWIRETMYNDYKAFAKFTTGKEVRYKMNPEIVTRQAGETAAALLADFKSKHRRK